ncbi:hypothetical protein C4577_04345 [Candidatus Parcubacteria bacterium]|nr:MAG: hypothetical protein C4577_04345 [Candidatus Parcubacteria bacterium]
MNQDQNNQNQQQDQQNLQAVNDHFVSQDLQSAGEQSVGGQDMNNQSMSASNDLAGESVQQGQESSFNESMPPAPQQSDEVYKPETESGQPVNQSEDPVNIPDGQPVSEMQASVSASAMPTLPQIPEEGGGGKKIIIGVIVLILLLVGGIAGAYFYVPEVKTVVGSVIGVQPTPEPVVQQIIPSPTIAATPTPATIEEEVKMIEVGDIDTDLQGIDKDLNQL